jgi:hypothetical protein
MDCRSAQDRMIERLDRESRPENATALQEHLDICPECARASEEFRQTADRLRPTTKHRASPRLKERIMKKISEVETVNSPGSVRSGWSWRRKLAMAGAVAAAWVLLTLGYNHWVVRDGANSLSAFSVLAEAAEACSGLKSIYIRARIRALPYDNFETIRVDWDFVDHEMWKEFGEPSRWRVEKTGRVAVMDGETSTLLIRGNPTQAARGGTNTGFVGWFKPLLNAESLLDHELKLAQRQGSDIRMTHHNAADGSEKIIVTVGASAQGNFSQNESAKNSSITESDNIRVYVFDAQTRLLENLEVYVLDRNGETLVFETEEIRYNDTVDPALFTLEVPEDAIWHGLPDALPQTAVEKNLTPKEVATRIFEALAASDWDALKVYWPATDVHPKIKEIFGGCEIIEIGEPFKSGLYPGWKVPYEIRLASGGTKKFNLAIRNDNPEGKWQWDGGL